MTRQLLKSIFEASIIAVKPENAFASLIKCEESKLMIQAPDTLIQNQKADSLPGKQSCFDFSGKDIFLLAFGKAAIATTSIFLQSSNILLRNSIKLLRVIHPGESAESCPFRMFFPHSSPDIRIFSAAQNNLPNEASVEATEDVLSALGSTKKWKNPLMLINLISGGGSALLCHPGDNISLDEKVKVIKHLTGRGATIQELNVARSLLSKVKGGQLLNWVPPNTCVINLIISDIVGDPVHLIASGPTVLPPSAGQKVTNIDVLREIICKHELSLRDSKPLTEESRRTDIDVHSIIALNNLTGINKGIAHAEQGKNFDACFCLTSEFQGDVEELVRKVMDTINQLIDKASDAARTCEISITNPFSSPTDRQSNSILSLTLNAPPQLTSFLFVIGGESTVTVKGNGEGGRNQHAALLVLEKLMGTLDLYKKHNVVFLSGGTDGQDGPTKATGAVVDCSVAQSAKEQNLNPRPFIENCDSYSFFDQLEKYNEGVHLKPGKTGTNVMDLVFVSATV